jgi:hypothetical protein
MIFADIIIKMNNPYEQLPQTPMESLATSMATRVANISDDKKSVFDSTRMNFELVPN